MIVEFIFVVIFLKCIESSPPFLSQRADDAVEEEDQENIIEEKDRPMRVPSWVKENGHAGKFEGDIKLSPNVKRLVNEGANRMKKPPKGKGAIKNQLYLWTNGLVSYEIDSVFDNYPSARKAIEDAIHEIHQISCVRFQLRTNQQYYIRFIRSVGCWSYVGKAHISGGQPISIGVGCDKVGIVLHEIMHAMGFFHTSSRYDRDSYVVVRYENIMQGYQHNFRKYTHGQIDSLEVPYDMTSLMHPPRHAFSKNGFNTIEARAGSYVHLGNTVGLSKIDKAQINLLYSCTGHSSCFKALGMESFKIPDSQITASSYKLYHEPNQGRLHMGASAQGNGAWCAKQSNQQGEWLQVDLGGKKTVTGIATQGKLDVFLSAWTTNLVVWGRLDQSNWYQAFNGKVLNANFDMNSAKFNQAPVPFTARYVRFEPKRWYNEICLRVEIYGCDGMYLNGT
ncbi:zinc metalloproteinase nas-4-like isoform X1 [Montipora capricornis]|uniref:zinc metalloproteinase nas-4-like isoform X1 n=1 Tax=Montipora capricornis TaxID=246305 RepID=UPI0035F14231